MWPWDNHSMPKECFISHSYKDAHLVQSLAKRLPRHVTPFVFPPIDVPPDQRVSDDLVSAILGCPGLIHIVSENSSSSVWVNFERDFALRSGRQVYSFDGASKKLTPDKSAPLDLAVFPYYSRRDGNRAQQVIAFMKTRHFGVFGADWIVNVERDWETRMQTDASEVLKRGGYLVAFLSHALVNSRHDQPPWLTKFDRDGPDQILPVLLDDIGPELPRALAERNPIRLSRNGAPEEVDWNRVDDLIVRIYDLIFRSTR